jgi:hypothetical protein
MSNVNKTAIADYVETKANELKSKRVAWEEGTLKRSNEELYELLSACLDFHNDLKGNTTKCKALNDHLRREGIDFKDSTSLATRVVRAVFNSSFQKRAYSYARVITIAAAEKSPNVSMSDFITRRGGIEELRRTKQNGKSPSDERKDRIAVAETTLSESAALVAPFKVSSSTRKPNDGKEHSLFVAVMREEADGSYSMVFETSTPSVVNSALEQAGKELLKAQQEKKAEDSQRQNRNDSDGAAETASEFADAA